LAVLVDKLLQAPYIFGSTHRGAARYINDPREFFLQIFIKIKKIREIILSRNSNSN
jgi:hypothetical protein